MTYLKNCYFAPKTCFLTDVLRQNHHKLNRVYSHPFNQQLFDGTLDKKVFGRYLRDDFYYLQHFAQRLKSLAQKSAADHPDLAQHLQHLATNIVSSEQAMQTSYAEHFIEYPQYQPGEAISRYTDFLKDTTEQAPLQGALSSILPCFWIYRGLGTTLKMTGTKYQQWIATYRDEKFVAATEKLAETVNAVAKTTSQPTREEMQRYFSMGVDYELAFFDEVSSTNIFQPNWQDSIQIHHKFP